MQDERGTLGLSHHVDVLESLGNEDSQPANLVTRHPLDRRVARHYTECTGGELGSEPRGRTRPHRPAKNYDVFLLDPHLVDTVLIEVLCILFDF